MTNKFIPGDYVDRASGNYSFPGVVQSVYKKSDGKVMVDVEMAFFRMIHVFGEDQLRHITEEDYLFISNGIKRVMEGRNDLEK